MNSEGYIQSIIKLLEKFNVERYCLLGGMYDLVPHTKPILVTGTATGEQTLKDVRGTQRAGQQLRRTHQYCLGDLSGGKQQGHRDYGADSPTCPSTPSLRRTMRAACAYLTCFPICITFTMDLDRIKERARQQYDEVTAAMNRSPEVRGLVQQLERQYEDRVKKAEGGQSQEEGPPLSQEVEDFLNQMGDQFNQN